MTSAQLTEDSKLIIDQYYQSFRVDSATKRELSQKITHTVKNNDYQN